MIHMMDIIMMIYWMIVVIDKLLKNYNSIHEYQNFYKHMSK
jgi:hypothetical protein